MRVFAELCMEIGNGSGRRCPCGLLAGHVAAEGLQGGGMGPAKVRKQRTHVGAAAASLLHYVCRWSSDKPGLRCLPAFAMLQVLGLSWLMQGWGGAGHGATAGRSETARPTILPSPTTGSAPADLPLQLHAESLAARTSWRMIAQRRAAIAGMLMLMSRGRQCRKAATSSHTGTGQSPAYTHARSGHTRPASGDATP